MMQKIIEKAIERGWSSPLLPLESWDKWEYLNSGVRSPGRVIVTYREIYLDHSFAKAFFGEEMAGYQFNPYHDNRIEMEIGQEGYYECDAPSWKLHLMRLVLMDDSQAIKYLTKFL